MAQTVKNPPAMRETWVRSLAWEDPLEKGKATHSNILAWRIQWTNYYTIALNSCTSKEMLKILQSRLQQYMDLELPDVQVVFRKVRGTRNHISIFVGSSIKQ